MERRKFLVGVGATSIGGSAILGSGAFSRVESDRAVTIQVAEDPDAYLGLDECDTLHGDNYVGIDSNGHLSVDISENPNGGEGVNSNSRTWFHNVFQICNQGKEDACVWIQKDDDWPVVDAGEYKGEPRVDFYLEDDDETSIVGAENAQEVDLGECYCIGIRTNTHGIDANAEEALLDELDDTITLVADVECPDDGQVPQCRKAVEETWDEVGDRDESGGPVIVMGLDSELTPGSDSHGPPEEHADMVASLLDDVTNGEEGILVLGGYPNSNTSIIDYWEGDVGSDPLVDQNVDFVYDPNEMETVDYDEYAMIGIVSGTGQISSGLNDTQNDVIIDRSDDLADFVNAGGGLLVKTQDGLSEPLGFLDPFGEFEGDFGIDGAGYGNCPGCIEITEVGDELGLEGASWDSWCCWHDVFTEYPDFLEVLAWNRDSSSSHPDEVAALGGDEVIVERQVQLSVTGLDALEESDWEYYGVELENQSEDSIEGGFEVEVVSGNASVDHDLPEDDFELGSDEAEMWEEGLELTCNGEGVLEVEVSFITGSDDTLVSVTVEIECVSEDPGVC